MADKKRRPIKVLNALWHLGIGGIETSLVELLVRLDPERFQIDFLVNSQFEGHHDAFVKARGARIILGQETPSPGRNLVELARINRRFGPYDVLHSHRHYSGVPLLRAAHQLGIPVRIAHSHAIRSAEGSLVKRAGFAVAQQLTKRYCTHGLAVSRPAAASLFGARWERDPRFEVVPLGVDFAPFQENANRAELRKALGIGEHQIALAHVGRFAFVKNHEFIVAVAKAINRLSPDYRIVLVGDGPLLTRIQYLVHHEGLADRVIFLGSQPNVAEILLAMDAFIFPSTSEAFGIAAIEAQAAGLECFLSDRVVSTVDIVPELLHRLPLEAGPEAWAQEIISHTRPDISQAQALEKCLASDLNIDSYVEKHDRIYSSVPA